MMNNYRIISLFFLLLLIRITGSAQIFNEEVYKFSKALSIIEQYYVDSIDRQKLVEEAIKGMLKDLDPHSVYISKEDVQKMNEPLQGSFEGIGIQFNILSDTLVVVSPIAGGPSEQVGLLAGDRIVKIDNDNVAGIGITNEMVYDRLRGTKGTKVNVGIKRHGVNSILEYEIIRDKIPIYSLDASYMIDASAGYIKLNRFSATTMTEYKEAITKLKKKGAQHLILDLTNNGGGYLNTAFELADEFLQQGQMVVYTEGLNSPRQDYRASNNSSIDKGRVVIMIDEGSASASEIVTGAIQDWDRGVVVGRRSFGKGLVQRPFNLPDMSMMRLTIANYYTPTGRLIQKPYDKGVDEYHKELIDRYNNGELQSADSIHFPDSLKYFTLKNNRVVYGGGGIMPDYFVPIDTSGYSDYYRDLVRKGILNHFVIDYFDKNREYLESKYLNTKKFGDPSIGFQTFNRDFVVTDQMLQNLIKFAEGEKLIYNASDFELSKNDLKINLKALIARNLWGTNEFYEIVNQIDPVYLQAVKVIQNEQLYNTKLNPTHE